MADSSRESLLEHQVKLLEEDKRRLRLALRLLLSHVSRGAERYVAESALRDTQ